MFKIRLVTFYEAPGAYNFVSLDIVNDEDFDIIDQVEQLEEYVVTNIKSLNSPGFLVEDFEVPDSLEKTLILDICNGKSHGVWMQKSVDFNNELYLSWIFINKGGVWENFHLENNK